MNSAGEKIKIYVINLKRSIERRDVIAGKLNAYGLEYEFFEGVDGAGLDYGLLHHIQQQATEYQAKYGRLMLPGEIGAAMSHLNK